MESLYTLAVVLDDDRIHTYLRPQASHSEAYQILPGSISVEQAADQYMFTLQASQTNLAAYPIHTFWNMIETEPECVSFFLDSLLQQIHDKVALEIPFQKIHLIMVLPYAHFFDLRKIWYDYKHILFNRVDFLFPHEALFFYYLFQQQRDNPRQPFSETHRDYAYVQCSMQKQGQDWIVRSIPDLEQPFPVRASRGQDKSLGATYFGLLMRQRMPIVLDREFVYSVESSEQGLIPLGHAQHSSNFLAYSHFFKIQQGIESNKLLFYAGFGKTKEFCSPITSFKWPGELQEAHCILSLACATPSKWAIEVFIPILESKLSNEAGYYYEEIALDPNSFRENATKQTDRTPASTQEISLRLAAKLQESNGNLASMKLDLISSNHAPVLFPKQHQIRLSVPGDRQPSAFDLPCFCFGSGTEVSPKIQMFAQGIGEPSVELLGNTATLRFPIDALPSQEFSFLFQTEWPYPKDETIKVILERPQRTAPLPKVAKSKKLPAYQNFVCNANVYTQREYKDFCNALATYLAHNQPLVIQIQPNCKIAPSVFTYLHGVNEQFCSRLKNPDALILLMARQSEAFFTLYQTGIFEDLCIFEEKTQIEEFWTGHLTYELQQYGTSNRFLLKVQGSLRPSLLPQMQKLGKTFSNAQIMVDLSKCFQISAPIIKEFERWQTEQECLVALLVDEVCNIVRTPTVLKISYDLQDALASFDQAQQFGTQILVEYDERDRIKWILIQGNWELSKLQMALTKNITDEQNFHRFGCNIIDLSISNALDFTKIIQQLSSVWKTCSCQVVWVTSPSNKLASLLYSVAEPVFFSKADAVAFLWRIPQPQLQISIAASSGIAHSHILKLGQLPQYSWQMACFFRNFERFIEYSATQESDTWHSNARLQWLDVSGIHVPAFLLLQILRHFTEICNQRNHILFQGIKAKIQQEIAKYKGDISLKLKHRQRQIEEAKIGFKPSNAMYTKILEQDLQQYAEEKKIRWQAQIQEQQIQLVVCSPYLMHITQQLGPLLERYRDKVYFIASPTEWQYFQAVIWIVPEEQLVSMRGIMQDYCTSITQAFPKHIFILKLLAYQSGIIQYILSWQPTKIFTTHELYAQILSDLPEAMKSKLIQDQSQELWNSHELNDYEFFTPRNDVFRKNQTWTEFLANAHLGFCRYCLLANQANLAKLPGQPIPELLQLILLFHREQYMFITYESRQVYRYCVEPIGDAIRELPERYQQENQWCDIDFGYLSIQTLVAKASQALQCFAPNRSAITCLRWLQELPPVDPQAPTAKGKLQFDSTKSLWIVQACTMPKKISDLLVSVHKSRWINSGFLIAILENQDADVAFLMNELQKQVQSFLQRCGYRGPVIQIVKELLDCAELFIQKQHRFRILLFSHHHQILLINPRIPAANLYKTLSKKIGAEIQNNHGMLLSGFTHEQVQIKLPRAWPDELVRLVLAQHSEIAESSYATNILDLKSQG